MTQFAMHVEGKATHLLFPKTLIWNKFFGYLVSILKPPHSTSNFSIGQNFGYQGKMWISCNHMVFNQPAVDEFFFFKHSPWPSMHHSLVPMFLINTLAQNEFFCLKESLGQSFHHHLLLKYYFCAFEHSLVHHQFFVGFLYLIWISPCNNRKVLLKIICLLLQRT